MNVGDIIVPLVDATTGRPRGTIALPCLDADDGTRYFFGPLLVRASGVKRAQSLYRKIRHMATRRIATDAEMTIVRRRRPDLWEAVMHERHTQVEQEANKDTRRRLRRRRRAAERAIAASQQVDPSPPPVFVTPPRSLVLGKRTRVAPRRIVFRCAAGKNDDDDARPLAGDGDAAEIRAETHDLHNDKDDDHDDRDEKEEDDDGDDGDYDADGAGDLVPLVPSSRSRSTPLAGAAAAVTADTIYLVEATSRIVEFLGSDIAAPDDAISNYNDKNVLTLVSSQRGVKRTWEDILPAVAAWAAARDAVLVTWTGDGDKDARLGTRPYQRRRHRRKQERPMRALQPLVS